VEFIYLLLKRQKYEQKPSIIGRWAAFSGKCLQSRLFSFFVRVYQAGESVRPNVPPGSRLSELITSRVIIELKEENGRLVKCNNEREGKGIGFECSGVPPMSRTAVVQVKSEEPKEKKMVAAAGGTAHDGAAA
jgi:hypothetical protein